MSPAMTGDATRISSAGRTWFAYVGVAALLPATYLLLPLAWRSGLFVAGTLVAAAGVAAGVAINRPRLRAPWILLAASLALWVLGSITWAIYEYGYGEPVPVPSVADAFFLSAYPLQAGGVLWMIRARRSKRDRAGMIDSLIVAVALGVLAWVFVIAPYATDESLSLSQRAVSIAYPLCDLVLFSLLARLLFTPGRRSPSFWLLVGGLAVLLVSDIAWAVLLLEGAFSPGNPVYVGWLIYLAAWGGAALHPSMRALAELAPQRDPALSRTRLAILTGAALTAPLLTATPLAPERSPELAVGSAVMFVLVIARMYGLMVDVAQYRAMERMKDEFTSVVSHELRTPLTSIRGSLGLIAGGALGAVPEKAKRMIDIAVENTDRLVRLINDILDIERIDSRRVEMEKQPCEAAELLHQAAQVMQAMASEAGVGLSVRSQAARLYADPDRIIQTLTNLLSNAIKFSPARGIVDLSCERRGREVLFRVEDQGRGIPPDKLEAIFERFQQVDSSDSREKGGTGLGLAICRSIVEQHGGSIWASSKPGAGSALSFTVPALLGEEALPQTEGPALPEPAPAAPSVLVCDDDASVREVIGAVLSQRGYRVLAAASGEQAVELAAAERPEVIVLDLLMPGMSGWEAAAALKERPETEHIPIVILSVLARGEGNGLVQEPIEWLEKPVEEGTLFEALDQALEGPPEVSRVLIVEDDLSLAEVLIALFERHGLETFHAKGGSEAIELSQRLAPDLLVLDLMLPERDGFAVVDWLGQHDRLRGVAMVVYTARDLDEHDRERLRLNGKTQILTKGQISLEEFEQCVLELLGRITNGGALTDAAPANPDRR